jgi:hypothetical protein
MEKLRIDSMNHPLLSSSPKIEDRTSLGKKEFPFSIEVNRRKAADVLCDAGVPREKVGEISIIFVRKSGKIGENQGTEYNPSDKAIIINVDDLFEEYGKRFQQARQVQTKKEIFDKELGEAFMHESKHAGDDFKSKWNMRLYFALAIMSFPMWLVLSPFPKRIPMYIWHHINPFEYGADKFAKRNKNNPRLDGLIKLF